jgi:hypothetical protein
MGIAGDHRAAAEFTVKVPSPGEIKASADALKRQLAKPILPARRAAVISQACRVIAAGSGTFAVTAVAAIAQQRGWSTPVVQASLQALCLPFTDSNLLLGAVRQFQSRDAVVGFMMSGNIPGAGLHELLLTLLTGRAAMVRVSARGSVFFDYLARLLTSIDRELGARLGVFYWDRQSVDHFKTFCESCDACVAFGDDQTIATLAGFMDSSGKFVGFGGRASGTFVSASAASRATARRVAADIALFEQCGCLSPAHVFVEEKGHVTAVGFAACLAETLRDLAASGLPSASIIPFDRAVRIRSIREQARWRALNHPVRLLEGPLPGWTVIYDRDADYQFSPGYRTVFVSPADDLARRLAPVRGALEAFACDVDPACETMDDVERVRGILRDAGVSYLCNSGAMQSPPVTWPHGGGIFLRLLGRVI